MIREAEAEALIRSLTEINRTLKKIAAANEQTAKKLDEIGRVLLGDEEVEPV